MSDPTAILLVNSDGRVLHASPRACALLGVDPDTLPGAELDALIDVAPGCACGPPSALVRGARAPHPVRVRGTEAPTLELHVDPLPGELPRFRVRLQAEGPREDVPPLEALWSCPTLLWVQLDEALRVRQASEAFARRLGDDRPLSDRCLLELFPCGAHAALLRESLRTAKPHELRDVRIERAVHGRVDTSYWDASLLPLAGGQGLLHLREVTERVSIRKKLADTEEFNADMLRHAPDAICFATRDAIVLRNLAFDRMFGEQCTAGELAERLRPVDGRSLEWFALGRPEKDWLAPIECVADEGEHRKELQVYVRPVTVQDQPAILYAIRDQTYERRLERILLRSQKLETLGRIAAEVSHDFGNLLTLLAFDAEQARSTDSPEERSALLDDMAGTTERAQHLVREVMGFTREQPGTDSLVDLTRAMRHLQPILERALGRKRELIFTLPEGSAVAPVAAVHVEQLVLNLLSNARDATSEGDAIHVQVCTTERGTAEIHVRDWGVGMDPSVSARVFERFFTTKAETEGAGMGLSLVHDIVRRAGGRVRVHSRPGEGSHFVVELPLATANERIPPQAEHGRVHGDECIVVCHGDEKLRAGITRSLGLLGYHVTSCADCRQGANADPLRPADAWIVQERQLGTFAAALPDGREPVPVLCITRSRKAPRNPPASHRLQLTTLAKPFTPLELARALRSLLD